MRVEDYYPGGKRWRLIAAGIREDGKKPLFRSAVGKTNVLTDNRVDAYRVIRQRTAYAGFKVKLGCDVFRRTRHHRLPRGSRHAGKSAGHGGR